MVIYEISVIIFCTKNEWQKLIDNDYETFKDQLKLDALSNPHLPFVLPIRNIGTVVGSDSQHSMSLQFFKSFNLWVLCNN